LEQHHRARVSEHSGQSPAGGLVRHAGGHDNVLVVLRRVVARIAEFQDGVDKTRMFPRGGVVPGGWRGPWLGVFQLVAERVPRRNVVLAAAHVEQVRPQSRAVKRHLAERREGGKKGCPGVPFLPRTVVAAVKRIRKVVGFLRCTVLFAFETERLGPWIGEIGRGQRGSEGEQRKRQVPRQKGSFEPEHKHAVTDVGDEVQHSLHHQIMVQKATPEVAVVLFKALDAPRPVIMQSVVDDTQ